MRTSGFKTIVSVYNLQNCRNTQKLFYSFLIYCCASDFLNLISPVKLIL